MSDQDSPRVVIAAGGTGGHIYPGLALAEALRATQPGTAVEFLGTQHGMESVIVPNAGYRLHCVPMSPSVGRAHLTLPMKVGRAVSAARRTLRAVGADVVVAMGGYACVGPVIAARSMGIPVVVHESGALPGRANRLAARLTPHVATAFESASVGFCRTTRVTGMPMAAAIAGMDRAALRPLARQRWALPDRAFVVLVLGGSRGAASLNEAGVGLAQRWRGRDDIRLVLNAGRDQVGVVADRLTAYGTDSVATTVGYVDRMDLAYAAADLVVCRAGAGTVAELAAAGLPAVLVPFPHATDDHQSSNAAAVAAAGAAVVLADAQISPERLDELITQLRTEPNRLARMAAAASRRAQPNAAQALANWVLDVVDQHRRVGEWHRL